MVPEAAIEKTEQGLAPVGEGWFVLNAREAQEEVSDATLGCAHFPETEPTPYRDGWLPG
jgi:hypothetical protein